MVNNSCVLHHWASTGENHKIRDATHVVSGSYFRVALSIDLDHNGAASHVSSRARHLGRSHPAWPAPGGPEIGEDWNTGVLQDFVELLTIYLQRFGNGWQGVFAGATTPCIWQVFCWDTVFLATMLASSK